MRPTNCQKKCDKTQNNNRQKEKQTKRGSQNKKPKMKNVDTKKKRKTKRGTEKKRVKINWPTKVGLRKG